MPKKHYLHGFKLLYILAIFASKNTKPSRLALLTALILSFSVSMLVFGLHGQWLTALIILVLVFVMAYALFFYTIQYFIYRKIKLIYKFIYQTKATQREEFFYKKLLPQKSIDEVSREVVKWAEEKGKEIELLKQNEQFRKEFLMNLTHELRTPIFTVQGYIHTLLDGAIDDTEVNRQFLTNATKGIDRLVQLAKDLDEISRLESQKIPIVHENFIIQELIQDVYAELSLKAKGRKITMTKKKGTEEAIAVYADKQKIRQVVVNLVENALKYSHDEGIITAGCYLMDEGNVYIEISDNGPGIEDKHIPRLFERFYRADRSRSRDIGGTGLGLAIVKHIVEAHGHTVNVRSKVGVGSSFGFTLDYAKY